MFYYVLLTSYLPTVFYIFGCRLVTPIPGHRGGGLERVFIPTLVLILLLLSADFRLENY